MKCQKKLKFGYNSTKKVSRHLQKSKKSDKILKSKSRREGIVYSKALRKKMVITINLHYYMVCKKRIAGLLQNRMTENIACKTPTASLMDLKIDVNLIAKYLIDLFASTKDAYSVTKTKIGKLLSIVAFVFAANGCRLFLDSIYKYGDCGTIIATLNWMKNDLRPGTDRDDDLPISEADVSMNDLTERSLAVPEVVRKIIRDVYLNFGHYSPKALGDFINDIINDILNDDDTLSNSVDLSKLYHYVRQVNDCRGRLLSYICESRFKEWISSIKED